MDRDAIYAGYKRRMQQLGIKPADFATYMKITATISYSPMEAQHKRYHGQSTESRKGVNCALGAT